MTETALLADVVLPASAWPEKVGTASNTDRIVQMGKKAINPPGDAKPDLWIIQQIAKRMGLNWNYQGVDDGVAAVYEEMRQAMHAAINGITWERLEKESSVTIHVFPLKTQVDQLCLMISLTPKMDVSSSCQQTSFLRMSGLMLNIPLY
jgi:predicted molibdopterin-dependent oxidoreductase YjgC